MLTSLDWPLSSEEKRGRLMRLYEGDIQAADRLIKSGEAKCDALLRRLHSAQQAGAAADTSSPSPSGCEDGVAVGACESDESAAGFAGSGDVEQVPLAQTPQPGVAIAPLLASSACRAGVQAGCMGLAVKRAAPVLTLSLQEGAPVPTEAWLGQGTEPCAAPQGCSASHRACRRRSWPHGGGPSSSVQRGARTEPSSDSDVAGEADAESEPRRHVPAVRRRARRASWHVQPCALHQDEVCQGSRSLQSLRSFIGEDIPSFPFASRRSA
mmetsp:Transcript_98423/g.317320  ORF Transcript_98423/g.317320 Transcript_98423/m.317320 type:complete len:268 (-) Transcript_98423:133-936(-)